MIGRILSRAVPAVLAAWVVSGGTAAASFETFSPDGGGGAFPDHSNGRSTSSPSIQALPLEGDRIEMDGRLDEPAWKRAEAGRGFSVWDPDRGAIPPEETVFKVVYDREAIYFAVACLEHDPSQIKAKLSRRDRFSDSDLVSIYIDPYHDRTTGYNFRVNPLGVQTDSYMYNDGDRDDDWDAVWQAETYRDGEGWYAELRIPFSAIRYRTGESMTWGLQVYRYMHGRGLDTAWVTWDRETRGFISRFGEVTGIHDVPAPRQLEILPYVVGRGTDASTVSTDDPIHDFENVGADVKYGITADLSLNATLQPDFGQVEADPAVLNLSPFETYFQEKRPFFIEGSRFFQHPDFNLFYSRRIGAGEARSRIRYAGKVTGKVAGGVSVATLVASTDLTGEGQAHNLFKNGERLSRYFVTRLGKEFSGGRHRVNFMQTAVWNTADRDLYGDYASREAYTSGMDFDLNFRNRAFNVQGSVVGSVIDPEPSALAGAGSPAKRYGTGGALDIRKLGGKIRGGMTGRWESDKLSLNDLGFLDAPDEINWNGFMTYPYNPDGKSSRLNRAEINWSFWHNRLYAGRTGYDVNSGLPVWSYGRGHRTFSGTELSTWMQFRDYKEFWWGLNYTPEGTQRYETRGGPLISEPTTFGGWSGVTTDTRKDLRVRVEGSHFRDTALNHSTNGVVAVDWNQSSAVRHSVQLHFNYRMDDTQYLETVDVAARPGGVGIGGLSYVFGKIHQRTADVTLRTHLLFSRNKSLEVYAQPFLTVGDYTEPRELATPDTYDLIPYTEAAGYSVRDYDFNYASVNVNMVYRWEYRPGSTLFLVWTQSRSGYDERRFHPSGSETFRNDLGTNSLFGTEPENILLVKLTYWLTV